jgi:acyl carrier protein
MKKYIAVAFAIFAVLGFWTSPLSASCTIQEVHDLVSDWSGISTEIITQETELNGLGGRFWPEDAPDLISALEQLSEINIPQEEYVVFAQVGDIDDFVDATEYLKDEEE